MQPETDFFASRDATTCCSGIPASSQLMSARRIEVLSGLIQTFAVTPLTMQCIAQQTGRLDPRETCRLSGWT